MAFDYVAVCKSAFRYRFARFVKQRRIFLGRHYGVQHFFGDGKIALFL